MTLFTPPLKYHLYILSQNNKVIVKNVIPVNLEIQLLTTIHILPAEIFRFCLISLWFLFFLDNAQMALRNHGDSVENFLVLLSLTPRTLFQFFCLCTSVHFRMKYIFCSTSCTFFYLLLFIVCPQDKPCQGRLTGSFTAIT